MKIRFTLLAPLAALAAAAITPDAAACTLSRVSVEGTQVALVYDPFASTSPAANVPLRVETDGDCSGRSVEISVAPDVGSASPNTLVLFNGSATLPLQIEDRTGRSVLSVGGLVFSPNRIARLSLTSEGVSNADALVLGIEPGLPSQSGEYLGRARVLARLDHDSNVVTAPFDISATVIASVGLAAAGDMRLDLGEIRNGAHAQTRFVAYANTDYELRMRSDNGWVLRAPGAESRIPYEITVSGRRPRRESEARVTFERARADGRRVHDLVVTTDGANDANAGEYKDYVTIEISARL